ncbi:hypothetical protein PSI9734_00284 [Pseudidiomarina piscicola]|uniref:Uncharacterized protein n=1 Tax=Pseudidiomarina piscicola TaxID=2614830 RepID=A0A6S6WJD4_9GAMM|nr:hypothetical protein [Pseudidiomarina piscicola]CAB0149711.1 hypothetical protein PSI9734_00284 [Pseudidiomarina piscicola]VZT39159.1 hypothetical protein PSI9734_00284 [Pseudomonas aeruginosa]
MDIKFKKLFLFFIIFLIIISANLFYMKELGDDVAKVLGYFFSILIMPPLIGAFIGVIAYKISNNFYCDVNKIETIFVSSVIGLILPIYYVLMLSFADGL